MSTIRIVPHRAVLVACLLFGTRSAPLAAQPPQHTEPSGCWSFELANGTPTAGRLYLTPPIARFTMDSSRIGGDRVMLRLDTTGRLLDASERAPMSGWRRSPSGDSLTIGFSLGFAFSAYILAWSPARAMADTLYGRAMEWHDYGGVTVEHGAARAVRRRCPTP